jgi:hypothetical protein
MDSSPKFVQYDDENLVHVQYGPDYGQTSTDHELRWNDEDDFRQIETYYSLILRCHKVVKLLP